MSPGRAQQPYSPFQTLRDRCRAMGLPTWRCTAEGAIVEEPVEPGVAGLWLRSGPIAERVRRAAAAWAREPEPKIVRLFTACWLIPIPEEQRSRRSGLLASMALGPWALDGEQFAEACGAAGLDAQAARIALARLATFDEGAARRTLQSLQWMLRDLVSLTDHEGAVQGFTAELTQSYETIDLLYSLGRSMLDLEHPEKFVTQVCDRLHEHMPFGWLAARFLDDPRRAGPLASAMIVRGKPPCDPETLRRALDGLAKGGTDVRGFLADTRADLHIETDSRTLVQPITREGEVAGFIACGDKYGDDPQVSSYEMQLLEAASGYTGAMLENATLFGQQQSMFMGTLRSLTAAIDAKDRYTCGHSERVAFMAAQLARAAGLGDAQAEQVHICGLVHDVGKIGVPEAVLSKPGRLTDEEFALIKLHPEIGHRIIRDIPMLEDVLPGVLYHHERWDGRGYPHGVKGAEIPLFARLLALADTFDAMSSTRSYRAAMPRPHVLAEIEKNAGAQFDPDLARRFVLLDFAEYDRIVARHAREHGAGLAAAA
ncbi:MAG: HD-GYP domain-containing protein [Phycisphaerales bacterium]